jgi:hypothetical protein
MIVYDELFLILHLFSMLSDFLQSDTESESEDKDENKITAYSSEIVKQ